MKKAKKVIAILLFCLLLCSCINPNKEQKSETIYAVTTPATTTSATTAPSTTTTKKKTTAKKIEHYCVVEDCYKEGTYNIAHIISGEDEYYCYTHYKELEELMEMIMGY